MGGPFEIKSGVQFSTTRQLDLDHSQHGGRISGDLVIVSSRDLLAKGIFARVADLLGMSFRIVNVDVALTDPIGLISAKAETVVIVDFTCVQMHGFELEPEWVAILNLAIAFVDFPSAEVCRTLVGAGFVAIIDMGVNEGSIPLIVELARSGHSFVPANNVRFAQRLVVGDDALEVSEEWISETLEKVGLKPPSIAEVEVLRELLKGKSNKEIAAAIQRSVPTVKMHILRMCRRYGCANRVQLVLFFRAIREVEQPSIKGSAA